MRNAQGLTFPTIRRPNCSSCEKICKLAQKGLLGLQRLHQRFSISSTLQNLSDQTVKISFREPFSCVQGFVNWLKMAHRGPKTFPIGRLRFFLMILRALRDSVSNFNSRTTVFKIHHFWACRTFRVKFSKSSLKVRNFSFCMVLRELPRESEN